MRFDNAFQCKSGVVGMQFTYGKGAIISVFHNGKTLQVSDNHAPAFQQEALRKYLALKKFYTKAQKPPVLNS